MQVIAVGGCSHTDDSGIYAPGSYPAIVSAVTRDLALGLTIRNTVDHQLLVSENPPPKGSLLELQETGQVAERTGDQKLPPPFQFVLERLIGSDEGRHVPMFLDLPDLGTATELAELCRSLKRTPAIVGNQIRLCSERLEVLQECQLQIPEIYRIWQASLVGVASYTIERLIRELELTGITLEPSEINGPLVTWMRLQKVSVRLRSIDDFPQLSQFGQWGVAGVFTKQPSLVVEHIQSWNTPTKYNPRPLP